MAALAFEVALEDGTIEMLLPRVLRLPSRDRKTVVAAIELCARRYETTRERAWWRAGDLLVRMLHTGLFR